ncbi:Permease of the drug/metabolite transporter (DMT) superfamily protein [Minicystis rosea]|nr:Permease of the drug/metabolite transporter (DMT) superfamily protein [Minicystis rosea]
MAAVAASAWGIVPMLVKRAERSAHLDPMLEVLVLMAVMGIGAAPVMWRERRARLAVMPGSTTPWLALVVLAAAEALNVVCLFRAFRFTTVAVAMLTHNLAPVVVAVGAPLLLRERLGARAMTAAVIGCVGLAVMLRPWAAGDGARDLVGALWGAASALCFASVIVMNKRLSARLSGGELMCLRALLALPLLVALVPEGSWSHLTATAFLWLAIAGLGPGVAGGLLFLWGLRRIHGSHAATLTLLEPLVALGSAALVLDEPIGPAVLVGAALILAGTLAVLLPRSDA